MKKQRQVVTFITLNDLSDIIEIQENGWKFNNKFLQNKPNPRSPFEPLYSNELSKNLGADCVELHVGKFCRVINSMKPTKSTYLKLKKSAFFAKKIGLEVHAGHGLTYKSAYLVSKINCISELNIGHFIVAESLFVGLPNSIKKFRKILGY